MAGMSTLTHTHTHTVSSKAIQVRIVKYFICNIFWMLNPSSPKGGCTNPPNGYRPGAQNRTAKG